MSDRMGKPSIRRAVCTAAGWDYCEEHDSPLVHGSSPCGYLHEKPHHPGCMACFDAGSDFDYCRVCGRGDDGAVSRGES